MQKVNSFSVDHRKLEPGIYCSEVNGAYTYDIRMVAPANCASAPSAEVLHTLEHFLASFFREKTSDWFSSTVLYIGPMGCKTGFYFLSSVHWSEEQVKNALLNCCNDVLCAEEIPGATEITCGNYTFFDLPATKEFIVDFIIPTFGKKPLQTQYPFIP